MSQNDYIIANQSAPDFRSDLNDALQALASLSSGSTAPSPTYANMLWYDTGNNILKMRTEADDAWINVGYLDQSSNAFRILDDTQVVNTSGTQTGLLGDQTTATWETGTSTTESLVSPAKVKAAIEALAPATDVASEIASFSAGAVGTHCFANGPDVSFGSTTAGSNLNPVSAVSGRQDRVSQGNFPVGSSLSGTWMALGRSTASDNWADSGVSFAYGATLWVRIS